MTMWWLRSWVLLKVMLSPLGSLTLSAMLCLRPLLSGPIIIG